jgi:predicted small secreted protein
MVVPQVKQKGAVMIQKIAIVALVGASVVLAACNTVRGAGEDVQSAANCTENTVHGGRC